MERIVSQKRAHKTCGGPFLSFFRRVHLFTTALFCFFCGVKPQKAHACLHTQKAVDLLPAAMGSKNTTLRPLRKDDPEADAIMRFHGLFLVFCRSHIPPHSSFTLHTLWGLVGTTTVNKEQISHYQESFNSAAQGADTITKSQFDQIMLISGQHRCDDDDEDFAGLGISKRTMFSKIWKLFDVDKDGVMTVCSLSPPPPPPPKAPTIASVCFDFKVCGDSGRSFCCVHASCRRASRTR